MSQMSPQPDVLDYRHPATPRLVHSGAGIASVTFAILTAYPVYVACYAVFDSHRMPGHYFPLLVFSYAFWFVLLGAGIGMIVAVAGLRQKERKRGFARWGFCVNALYLVALAIMMVLTEGGTESA
jgi:hypothetical protein